MRFVAIRLNIFPFYRKTSNHGYVFSGYYGYFLLSDSFNRVLFTVSAADKREVGLKKSSTVPAVAKTCSC